MALMYPNQLSPDTESDAERQLYEAFRDGLDNDYIVFHSVAWLSLDGEGRPCDGETDFVIAHPQRGILVLEAKGGGIGYDPRTDCWTSTDRYGQSHIIRSPFVQARYSKYALQEHLQNILNIPHHRINVGHAVAFPDVVVGGILLGLDEPRQIILDATDLINLSGWVGGVLAYWRGQESQRDTAPGEEAVQALMDLLGKTRELHPALWGDFVQEREHLIRLTEQQYMILDVLNRRRRAAICGCAGSGKTMLAAEKASRLACQGFGVLLTCFNKHLAADLRARLKSYSNLDIVNFQALCYRLARQAGVLPVKLDDDVFFSQQLPEALVDAADALGVRYDAIIVDEGQDFLENWWVPLQMLLCDPDDGILYIFYDDNQRLYVRHGAFPIQQPPYSLTVNCRNTQNIHQVVMGFYEAGDSPSARGPHGRPVAVVSYEDAQSLRPTLQNILRWLTVDEHVPTDEIVVLTPRALSKDRLLQGGASEGPLLTDIWPTPRGQVYCTTIYDFKGLERAVVILADIRRWPPEWDDMVRLLYVGCSRARNHLIVLLDQNAPRKVQRAFTATMGRK
ncbi:MAG: ATP-binding domain-containing protein [Chloroflexota bacterium]|nr:ATP-binding domain-containing protein [Chloroflexota bacterium]